MVTALSDLFVTELIVNKMPRYPRDDRAMPLYISIRQRAVSLPQHALLLGLCLQTAVSYVNQIAHVYGQCEQRP